MHKPTKTMKYILLFFISLPVFSQLNTINEVTFSSLKKTKVSFLTNCIQTKSNTVLDSLKIKNDIQFLENLDGISNVEFTVTKIALESYNVNFDIKENISLIPTISIWTNNDNLAYRLGVYDFNFLGKNNTLGGFYQLNKNHSYGLTFKAPNLFTNSVGLALNLQSLSTQEPIFLKTGLANYDYRNSAAEIMALYQYDFKNAFKLGFSFFEESYKYVAGTQELNVPTDLVVNKQMFKLIYNFNNLTYDYYIVKGIKNSFNAQCILTENDFQQKFLIAWNDFFYFKKLGSNGNWASRLRVGFSTNNNSPFAPFSVDNNVNIRGVGTIIDRGTGAVVLNTEFRKTLYEKKWFVIQGNAFVDSGTWRKPAGNFNDLIDSKNIKVYSGLGLRFIHKTIFDAVLRIDYGVGLTDNSTKGLVIGIGQYF